MGSFGFAHISDLHLSDPGSPGIAALAGKRLLGWLSWRRRRRFEHRPEVLEQVVAELGRQQGEPLVITGDLTQIGLPVEFAAAARLLARLGQVRDLFLVPGNHDSYATSSLSETYETWRPYLGGLKLEHPGPRSDCRGPMQFIGLDSALPTPMFSARGRLGASQLQALDDCLADPSTREHFRVVYLHHPPEAAATRARKRLADSAKLLEILDRGGVDLVLHGHEHRPRIGSIRSQERDVPVIGVSSASAAGGGAEERRATIHQFSLVIEDDGYKLVLRPLRYQPDAAGFAELPPREFLISRRGFNA